MVPDNDDSNRSQRGHDRRPYGKGPGKGPRDRGERKGADGHRNRSGDRNEGRPRDRGDRRRSDRPRDEHGRRDDRKGSDRPRDGRGRHDDRREYRPRDERHEVKEAPYRPKLISNDPQKLLFRGVDLQSKGENDEAMLMYVHGSVLMSKGCENNASRLLDTIGKDSFLTIREAIARDCSEDALIEYDYLCIRKDPGYDRSYFDGMYQEGRCHAIYRRICMEEVDGEDPVIDTFAGFRDDPRVPEGLRLLVKRKDSRKAQDCIEAIKRRDADRQYIHTAFNRAMKGDRKSIRDLERLSSEFREAEFFLGYIKARESGDPIQWLKDNFERYGDMIISEEFNLRIGDTPYGLYLRAKKIQSKKEDWIPSMIKAAKNGSDEAMYELRPLMHRTDIRKAVSDIHLRNGDLEGLIDDYIGGLDDTQFLDKYCENLPLKIVDIGNRIGERDPMRHIDWLRAHAFMPECRDALVTLAKDERYHSRKLIFALHDVGKNIEAADLYFLMEGDPELPAVKWLQKVCRDPDAKEHVRQHYESIGDTKTFDYIFEDDGYRKRPSGRNGFRKKRF